MIQRVAVVGAGTMGLGIAQLCAQSGFSVKVHDALPAALAALPGRLKTSLDAAVLKGKLSTQQAERAFHSISAVPELADLGIAQSTRAYQPMFISHYGASWVNSRDYPAPAWPGSDWDRNRLEQLRPCKGKFVPRQFCQAR